MKSIEKIKKNIKIKKMMNNNNNNTKINIKKNI